MPRILVLTEGYTNPRSGKTAASVIRYRGTDVVAVLDSTQCGGSLPQLLHVGEGIPIVGSIAESPPADTLLLGTAPPGGELPAAWRPVIKEAITRGMNVVSGLHDFLSNDAEFVELAERHGVALHDVRKNNERAIARRSGLREDCLRIQTVGHDCSIGKMVVAIEVARGLQAAGRDAKFVATGQTGIMIEGDGCPVDCVVADFISGAAERLILENQQHEILVVEGQGSLVHPSYSGVTLGLLHGALPHGLILCYEVGRTHVLGVEHVAIPPLSTVKQIYEVMANIHQPCQVIGIGMNSRKISAEEAEKERERIRKEFGLPVCDVLRHGAGELVGAVLDLHGGLIGGIQ